jgi:hypothetical protein
MKFLINLHFMPNMPFKTLLFYSKIGLYLLFYLWKIKTYFALLLIFWTLSSLTIIKFNWWIEFIFFFYDINPFSIWILFKTYCILSISNKSSFIIFKFKFEKNYYTFSFLKINLCFFNTLWIDAKKLYSLPIFGIK